MSGYAGFFFALALSILAMIAAGGVVTLGVTGWMRFVHYSQTRRLIGMMRRAGRCLSRAEFEERLASSTGTVLVEFPTIGWRILWVWWTADDVVALARAAGVYEEGWKKGTLVPAGMEAWCREQYLDRQRGRALLVPIYAIGKETTNLTGSLRERSPALSVVNVRTAVAA